MAKEGVVRAYTHHNNQVLGLVQVSCDSDFVGRNAEFLAFVDELAMHVAFECPDTLEELLSSSLLTNDSKTIAQYVAEQRKKFGEDIKVIRFARWDTTFNPDVNQTLSVEKTG
ncbi:MAG: hypothetical protein HXY23_14060 [Parvularculaceae bacterium]|nr:hypothetical protein [Parvularculaceae bacterium]